MSMRDNLDISAYLVLGPENTLGRPVADVVAQAVAAGFTCVQVRSKECSARELISCTAQASEVHGRPVRKTEWRCSSMTAWMRCTLPVSRE